MDFNGLVGCAVPGSRHYRIPETEFQELVRGFQEADFFHIPRLDVTRVVFDAVVITVTYKDERRIHETVDAIRGLPRLTQLEKRLRAAANVERFLKPSLSLYQELLRSGWDVNTLGEDHENALTSALEQGTLIQCVFCCSMEPRSANEPLCLQPTHAIPHWWISC